jgi:hypothetical protein
VKKLIFGEVCHKLDLVIKKHRRGVTNQKVKNRGFILWRKDAGSEELYEISVVVLNKEILFGGQKAEQRIFGKFIETRVRVKGKLVPLVLMNGGDIQAVKRYEKILETFTNI